MHSLSAWTSGCHCKLNMCRARNLSPPSSNLPISVNIQRLPHSTIANLYWVKFSATHYVERVRTKVRKGGTKIYEKEKTVHAQLTAYWEGGVKDAMNDWKTSVPLNIGLGKITKFLAYMASCIYGFFQSPIHIYCSIILEEKMANSGSRRMNPIFTSFVSLTTK